MQLVYQGQTLFGVCAKGTWATMLCSSYFTRIRCSRFKTEPLFLAILMEHTSVSALLQYCPHICLVTMLRGSVSKIIEDFLLELECFIPDYARTVPATTTKTRKSDVNVATKTTNPQLQASLSKSRRSHCNICLRQ
jgi:hypothetical protein